MWVSFPTLLPPANEVCEGYVFTGVCHSVHRGGMHGCPGGMHGCSWGGACVVSFGGACMVALGGMHGFIWGACVVLFGRACVVLFGGACVVLFGGHAWFYLGGRHAWFYSRGGVRGFFSFFRYNEIRSMSGRYASYWNAFLYVFLVFHHSYLKQTALLKFLSNQKQFNKYETTFTLSYVDFTFFHITKINLYSSFHLGKKEQKAIQKMKRYTYNNKCGETSFLHTNLIANSF